MMRSEAAEPSTGTTIFRITYAPFRELHPERKQRRGQLVERRGATPRWGKTLNNAESGAGGKFVLFHAVPELVAGNPQERGRLGLVAAGAFQGLGHEAFFELLENDAPRGQGERLVASDGGRGTPQQQVALVDDLAPRQETGAFERVPQFPDVTRPRMALQTSHGLRRHGLEGLLEFARKVGEEVIDQRRNVLRPLAQRRQVDRNDVQPVEEV